MEKRQELSQEISLLAGKGKISLWRSNRSLLEPSQGGAEGDQDRMSGALARLY